MKSEEAMKKIKTYEGKEPYVFLSYSHKDSDYVLPLIEALKKNGCRVWFDAGLTVGVEWMNAIAEHLEKCSAFLFVMTDNSAESPYCLDEVAFARTNDKPSCVISVSPDVKVSDGLGLTVSRFQSVRAYECSGYDALFSAIRDTGIIDGCFEKEEPEKAGTKEKPETNEKLYYKKRTSPVAAVIGLLAAFAMGFAVSHFAFPNVVVQSPDGQSETDKPAGSKDLTKMTVGLEFNDSGWVMGYHGMDKNVIIPSVYDGKIVERVQLSSDNIESIEIPDTVKYLWLDNMPLVEKLSLPGGARDIRIYEFEGLSEITIGEGAEHIEIGSCPLLKELSLPDSAKDFEMSDCGGIEKLNIPDSLKTESINYCPMLQTIKVAPYVEMLRVAYCPFISSLTIPETVTELHIASLDSLEALTIPESVTWLDISHLNLPIDAKALPAGIKKLTLQYMQIPEIAFPDGIEEVLLIGVESLKKLDIPESVKKIELSILPDLSELTFYDSAEDVSIYSLESDKINYKVIDGIRYLGSVTNPLSVLVDGRSAVGDIIIPDGVRFISNTAFSQSEITSVKLPDSVIGIKSSAFIRCSQLTEFSFPKKMKRVDVSALSDCSSLKKIVFPGGDYEIAVVNHSIPSIEEIVFEGEHSIYYTDGKYLYSKEQSYENYRFDLKEGGYWTKYQ